MRTMYTVQFLDSRVSAWKHHSEYFHLEQAESIQRLLFRCGKKAIIKVIRSY